MFCLSMNNFFIVSKKFAGMMRTLYANPYLLTDMTIQLYNDGDIKALKWMVL